MYSVAMVMVVVLDMKYHGHSLYYQATVLAIARGYSKFIVAMATVVMGDTCVQSITAIHTIICLK